MGNLILFECLFRICPSYNSSRDNGGFLKQCLTTAKKSKNSPFLGPEGHNFHVGENWLNSFVIIFDEHSNAFFRFSLRPIGAEIDGGSNTPPPPPVGSGKSGVPMGRGLTLWQYNVNLGRAEASRTDLENHWVDCDVTNTTGLDITWPFSPGPKIVNSDKKFGLGGGKKR